jgi:hypothetical protein
MLSMTALIHAGKIFIYDIAESYGIQNIFSLKLTAFLIAAVFSVICTAFGLISYPYQQSSRFPFYYSPHQIAYHHLIVSDIVRFFLSPPASSGTAHVKLCSLLYPKEPLLDLHLD